MDCLDNLKIFQSFFRLGEKLKIFEDLVKIAKGAIIVYVIIMCYVFIGIIMNPEIVYDVFKDLFTNMTAGIYAGIVIVYFEKTISEKKSE